MQPLTRIVTSINEKYIDAYGILQIKVLDGVHIDLMSLKEDHASDFCLTGHNQVLAFFDARAFFSITKEARDYVNSGIMDKTRLATAVLINNLAVRTLMNGFSHINKPKTPFKVFTSEDKAIEWLLLHKKITS
ncbi:MAG: hypothetical protein ABIP51_09900 [Bacteroidia bacterium]